MNLDGISRAAKIKGIDLVGTGDFTHYQWLSELKAYLKPVDYGIYEYKGTHFCLTAEVSNIFSQEGKTRRIHNLIFAPSFEVVEKINRELGKIGNLDADGRPILGMSARDLLVLVMGVSKDCFFVPAHIWTPWFSLFGANSGFDDIYECFGDMTRYIFALETGLSSDPEMNWSWSSLDRFALISNSDAHSPDNLGREANIFDCKLEYSQIIDAIKRKDRGKFLETLEFFPQEGKYHYDGHRDCKICFSPQDSKRCHNICPKCKRSLTIGVMHRVNELADRDLGFRPEGAVPFRHLVPLKEIIAAVLGRGVISLEVRKSYDNFIEYFGNEFRVLCKISPGDLTKFHPRIAQGILRVREGRVRVHPGYDGVYGKVKIFEAESEEPQQMNLF
jgi:uncharacterized protein (TIGR00375 family)